MSPAPRNSAPPLTPPRARGRDRHRSLWPILVICGVAQFMVVLDVTIVNVALPQMRTALGLSATGQQWVVNAYTLTFGGFLMLAGRAADLLGRRRVFMAGLATFTVFSLLGGLAPTGGPLIAARALQGIGGAILAPASLSLLTSTFTDHDERRRALGVWSATAASGAAGGVLLGGILTDVLDWRWVLFVNVPVGIALLIATSRVVSETRSDFGNRRLDLPGAFTVTAGLAVLIYAIVGTDSSSWGSAHTLSILGAGVVLLCAFLLIEMRVPSPVIPLGVFRRRSLSAANAVSMIVGPIVFGTYFFVSLYLQQVDRYSPLRTGLAFLPMALGTLLGALLASRVVARVGARGSLRVAPVITAGGLVWLSQLSAGSAYLGSLLVPLALVGTGVGLTFVPMTLSATAGMPREQAGLASGLINTSRQVGGAVGLAALVTVATTAAKHAKHTVALSSALTHGYDRAFLVMAGMAVAAAAIASLLPHSVQGVETSDDATRSEAIAEGTA